MGKNRKAALELATTPHVPGANYAPAHSPGRMVTARMSAPRPAEERESSSFASEDDGENREPLPSHQEQQQQQQHIAAGAHKLPCPSTRGSSSNSYLATTPCPRARQPCTSHALCTRTARATLVPRSTRHNSGARSPNLPGRGSAATPRSLPLATLPLSQACPLYKETDIVEDTLCL